MPNKTIIQFILTGGTIDSYYSATKDTAVPNEHSVIPQFIQGLKLYERVVFTEICMKDSRDLVRADLEKIVKTVAKSKNRNIIITHGTYTMSDTARYLQAKLRNLNKTIVFTGSMIPLVGFSPSDAPFNLGYAVAKVLELPAGIYVCMNGYVFEPEEVMKVLHRGKFISIFGEKKGQR